MKQFAAAVLLGLAGLVARELRAEPTIWEQAREPRALRVERALTRMERVLDGVSQADGDPDMMQDFRLGTLAVAEMTGARELADPRLLVLLAQALLGAELEREVEADGLLDRALSGIAPGDGWLEAEIRVLRASAARRDPTLALEAATQALDWAWDASLRSTLFRERADAKMALGDVRGSKSDARAALGSASTASERALARFGLGLALEREGDLPSALEELRIASLLVPSTEAAELGVLSLPGVFAFRPADVSYVRALTAMGRARLTDDEVEARDAYALALAAWARFLDEAGADDRYRPAARTHAEVCRRELRGE